MTIISPNNETKAIAYFNRSGVSPFFVKITNETTQVSDTFLVESFEVVSYYNTLEFTPSSGFFQADNFYMFKILGENDEVIFKDKIFCAENPNSYSINRNQYTEHSTTNEYIVYE